MRYTAYNILRDFEEHKVFINLRLKKLTNSDEDIKQITIRIYGILQNYDYLNYLISETTKGKKIDPKTRRILLLAVYEYLYLDSVPEYAIISEYTKLIKRVNQKAQSFVSFYLNNELKNVKGLSPKFSNNLKNESITYSHPLWVVKRLAKQYPDEYLEILKANQQPKKITARVVNKLIEPELFTKFEYDDLVYLTSGNILKSNDFKQGNLQIQDLGSYLVGHMVAPKPGEVILDLCAAPGNKTMHIAKTAKHVYANEINESRCELLKANITAKQIDNITVLNTDASDLNQVLVALANVNAPEKFDKILLDVPCSGWGVFGSKPESKYYQNQQEITEIVKLQGEILKVAEKLLSDTGEIIYSTCTVNRAENGEQLTSFMTEYGFDEVHVSEFESYKREDELGITLLPFMKQTDGFYMCKIKRK